MVSLRSLLMTMRFASIAALIVLLSCSPHPILPSTRQVETSSALLGVAMREPGQRWCAMFAAADSPPVLKVGDTLTLIVSGPAPSLLASVLRVRPGLCRHALQDSVDFVRGNAAATGVAYELSAPEVDSEQFGSYMAHAVLGASSWRPGKRGWKYGDLEGDGVKEIARFCASREGVHLTLWRRRWPWAMKRLAHYYYPLPIPPEWEPTCTADEAKDSRTGSPAT